MALSSQVTGQSICFKTSTHALSRTSDKKAHQIPVLDFNKIPQKLHFKSTKKCKCLKLRNQKWLKPVAVSSNINSDMETGLYSATDTIMLLYASINEKNLKQLSHLISDDCFYDDLSFPEPFRGKKEVLHFFEHLTSGMGTNMEFNIESSFKGDDNKAAVTWHLVWKKRQVPFTRGSSFYELSSEHDRLVIKKAQVVTESLIKPGVLALGLLKTVSSIFDALPEVTERFLQSPHAILQLITKTCYIVLGPFIAPIIAYYINFWNLISRMLSFTLKIFLYILKFFYKD